MTSSTRYAIALLLSMSLVALTACGDDDEETPSGNSERPDDPCATKGSRAGVWGRVVSPSCASFVPTPEVTLYDALQFEVAKATGDDFGQFSFDAGTLPGDGQYLLTVTKGPYSGPDAPMPFSVSGGSSDYQIVKLQTGGE